MRKLFLIVPMLAAMWAGAQSPINRIEYFFNTDPGFGQAAAVSFTSANNIADLNFSPDITGLNAGINRLYIRSRTNTGLWSQTANQVFFKVLPVNASPRAAINRIEYFFNSDPGFGQATTVSFSSSTNVQDLGFAPDLGGLPAGINRLFVRSRDANGKWSQVANQVFFKLIAANALPPANIVAIEYFFNTDPGTGFATAASFTPGADINNLIFTPDISSLPQGINRFFVRSKNANGKWSQVANQVFYKLLPKSPAAPISRMEYFINTDPGIGNAVPVVFYKADSLTDLSFPVNISGLPVGQHLLYLRSSDTLGKWSLTAIDTIRINTPVAQTAIIVNSLLLNPEGSLLNGFSYRISSTATLCAGNEIRMAFDPGGIYNPGNIFTVELSNETGNFSSPIKIGEVNSVKGAATICRLPRHLTAGSNYKIRVVSSSPVVVGDPTTIDITIDDINIGPDATVYLSCPDAISNLLPLYNTNGLIATWNTASPASVPAGMYRLIVNNEKNCPDTAFAEIKLEVATWSGITSSDWHNPANWNINKVPGRLTHVIIPFGTANACVISSSDAEAASIQVRAASLITILNNRKLSIAQNCNALPAD